MLFKAPEITPDEAAVIEDIERIRKQVRHATAKPRRWSGMLRRNMLAEAMRGSNSIEGINASFEDAVAVLQHDEPLNTDEQTKAELTGYRNAMTYILQLAYDPSFTYQEGFIRSLHFMMLQHDLTKNPGKWRPSSIFVRDERTKQNVYEGPPREIVEPLIAELIEKLNEKDGTPQIIRAAMSHLNLVMIHPFSDGNGRMARCLQTLVLAREGILEPEFCSVEEYLGRQQQAYYDVLAEVGQGSWHPERNARPWIRFMLKAHYAQAHKVLWVNNQLERLWVVADKLTEAKGLHPRTTQPVVDAMIGVKVRNSSYRSFMEISENLASRDLKALVDAGFLVPKGEKRGRHYEASKEVKEIAAREIVRFIPPDPFAAKPELQPSLWRKEEDDGA